MTRKRQRLYFVVLGLLGFGVGAALVLTAFQDNIVFFFSPSEVTTRHLAPEQRFRVGGLVEAGSLVKNGEDISFSVTDLSSTLKVQYRGLLPDLFREGQGVIAEGRMEPGGVFIASEVLAKHDENYMPREVADALKKSGRWNEGGATQSGMPANNLKPTSTTPASPNTTNP
ncbi:MAG: cytochrome c maturation protein CcmE [Rhodospirillaceae bacterium]|nr:cytochrome c maturation protein CcmE [Rhodospirillaceae bacterium]